MIGIIIPAVAAVTALGYAMFRKKPVVLQSMRASSSSGLPVQVVVPVTSAPAVSGQTEVPIPPTNTGTGANYAPKAVVESSDPGTLVLGPTLITDSGAASLAVQTSQDIQNALNTLGYANPPLAIDGNIGPASKAAIRAFQAADGLAITGLADQSLKNALQSAIGGTAGTSSHIGALVDVQTATDTSIFFPFPLNTPKEIQHGLNLLGASPALTEDGQFGPRSIAATKAFQIHHGLVADGVAGPKTRAALALALSQS